METRSCIRRPRTIGVTSIQSESALATMRGSAMPRPWRWPICGSRSVDGAGRPHLQYIWGRGMRADDGRVISNFIVQALYRAPVNDLRRWLAERSFCYVDDTVDGLVRLLRAPDASGTIVNIGNPEERSVAEIAERVIAAVGAGEVVLQALPPDDPRRGSRTSSGASRWLVHGHTARGWLAHHRRTLSRAARDAERVAKVMNPRPRAAVARWMG